MVADKDVKVQKDGPEGGVAGMDGLGNGNTGVTSGTTANGLPKGSISQVLNQSSKAANGNPNSTSNDNHLASETDEFADSENETEDNPSNANTKATAPATSRIGLETVQADRLKEKLEELDREAGKPCLFKSITPVSLSAFTNLATENS